MKRISWVLFLACWAAGAQGGWVSLTDPADMVERAPEIRVLGADRTSVELELTLPGFRRETVEVAGEPFDGLTVPGLAGLNRIGEPDLPTLGRLVAVPGDRGITLEVLERETVTLEGYRVAPAQPLPDRCGSGEVEPVIRWERYAEDALFPAEAAVMEPPEILREVRLVRLELRPIRSHPARDRLEVDRRIRVRLRFEGPAEVNPLDEALRLSPAFLPLYEQWLLAFQEIAGHRERDAAERALMICHDAFQSQLAPLVAWRRQTGLQVTVTPTSVAGTSAAAIRSYLAQVWAQWSPRPSYVLLVGDSGQIGTNSGIGNCASDEKYSLLQGGDMLPDVFIGRLSGQTGDQIETMAAKALLFEQDLTAGEAWQSHAVGISSSENGDDSRLNRIRTDLLAAGTETVDRLYQSNGTATVTQIQNAVNAGRIYLTYMGHGTGTSWSSTSPSFTKTHIGQLTNTDRNLFIMDVSCDNGGFLTSECFAEKWVRHGSSAAPKGAVGIYSSSTETAWVESGTLGEGYAYSLTEGADRAGSAALGAMLYLRQQMGSGQGVEEVFNQYVLFSDPALRLRYDRGEALTVLHPDSIPQVPGEAVVEVRSGGSPVAQALGCLWKEGEFQSVETTGADGRAVLTTDPQTDGEAWLTVTALNSIPYQAALPVRNAGCGVITLDREAYRCSGTVEIRIRDSDLNGSPTVRESTQVDLTSDSQPAGLTVALTETGPDSGEFLGTAGLAEQAGTGILLVAHGDVLRAEYQDADCDGSPVVAFQEAAVDCRSPVINELEILDVTAQGAWVTWSTDEPADSVVLLGEDGPPDTEISDPELGLDHAVELGGLESCQRYFLSVSSTDEAGNRTLDDQGGGFHWFQALGREYPLLEDMSTDPGWVVSGAWACGQPTGQGGDHGGNDPTGGRTGSRVYGYNLNGGYTNNMPQRHLRAGPLDCSQADSVRFSFWRWLGVETSDYDHASVAVSAGGTAWTTLWQNPATTLEDSSWHRMEFDISGTAAGSPAVYLRWTMGETDVGWTYGGWNVDDVEVSYEITCPTPIPPTPTPEGTPLPDCPQIALHLDQEEYQAGDPFRLTCSMYNPLAQQMAETFIILDAWGIYYYWPLWGLEIDWATLLVEQGHTAPMEVLSFPWPEGAGQGEGLRFWGALLEPGTGELFCDVSMVEFDFR